MAPDNDESFIAVNEKLMVLNAHLHRFAGHYRLFHVAVIGLTCGKPEFGKTDDRFHYFDF